MHDHLFQLDLDGQVTCSTCHCMDDEPEALFETGYGYDELKDFDMGLKDNRKSKITPFMGPNR